MHWFGVNPSYFDLSGGNFGRWIWIWPPFSPWISLSFTFEPKTSKSTWFSFNQNPNLVLEWLFVRIQSHVKWGRRTFLRPPIFWHGSNPEVLLTPNAFEFLKFKHSLSSSGASKWPMSAFSVFPKPTTFSEIFCPYRPPILKVSKNGQQHWKEDWWGSIPLLWLLLHLFSAVSYRPMFLEFQVFAKQGYFQTSFISSVQRQLTTLSAYGLKALCLGYPTVPIPSKKNGR